MLLTENKSIEKAPFDDISFELCSRRKDVIVMSADLSKYPQAVRIRGKLSDQHLDVSMAEQNLISVAAGISKAGFVPIATTFAC